MLRPHLDGRCCHDAEKTENPLSPSPAVIPWNQGKIKNLISIPTKRRPLMFRFRKRGGSSFPSEINDLDTKMILKRNARSLTYFL